MAVIGPLSWSLACLEYHHLPATGSAIEANTLINNAFEEGPSPSHRRRATVAEAPAVAPKHWSREARQRQASLLQCSGQWTVPLAGFYASLYYA